MTIVSMRDQRIENILETGKRSKAPCMRCLENYAKGKFNDQGEGCTFGNDYSLWTDFADGGAQAMRCLRCVRAGQDCFAAPDSADAALDELESSVRFIFATDNNIRGALNEAATEDAELVRVRKSRAAGDTRTDKEILQAERDNQDVPAQAGDPKFHLTDEDIKDYREKCKTAAMKKSGKLVGQIRGSHGKYADSLTAHTGALLVSELRQSGIYLRGRDRTKIGLLSAERRRQAKLEQDEESEEELTPKTKRRFGVRGRGKTQAEVEEEEELAAAAAAAKEKRREAAKKGAATKAAKAGKNQDIGGLLGGVASGRVEKGAGRGNSTRGGRGRK